MELYYEGKNITNSIEIVSAKGMDASGGKCDCLDLTLGNSKAWYLWKPQPDDKIELRHDGYSTGTLFINAIAPEGDQYRILATSAKNKARKKNSQSYENITLDQLMQQCAAECNMEYRLFGISPNLRYEYLQRNEESCMAFLNRIAKWEGAVLKTYSGRLTMISIKEAQKLLAGETIMITDQQSGVTYERRETGKINRLTVKTPFSEVTAEDKGATNGYSKTVCNIPAKDSATAGRWARGLLLNINRCFEKVLIESEFHGGWSAMVRVNITGNTDASGEWIVDEVEHNFVEQTSAVTLYRIIETVV